MNMKLQVISPFEYKNLRIQRKPVFEQQVSLHQNETKSLQAQMLRIAS